MQARAVVGRGHRLERGFRRRLERPRPVTHEAVQRMRVRGGDVGLEPVRGRVVLDECGEAAVVVAIGPPEDQEPSGRRQGNEQRRAERGATEAEPGQHGGSSVASIIGCCQDRTLRGAVPGAAGGMRHGRP